MGRGVSEEAGNSMNWTSGGSVAISVGSQQGGEKIFTDWVFVAEKEF